MERGENCTANLKDCECKSCVEQTWLTLEDMGTSCGARLMRDGAKILKLQPSALLYSPKNEGRLLH